jgi:hypothetical protein
METNPLERASGLAAAITTDPLLDERQAGEYLGGVSARTMQRWRYHRRGPVYIAIGKLIRYRRSSLDRFLTAGERLPAQVA